MTTPASDSDYRHDDDIRRMGPVYVAVIVVEVVVLVALWMFQTYFG